MEPLENQPSSSASPQSSAAASAPSAAAANPSTYQAQDGAGESVPGGQLLVAAYAIAWVVVLLFVVHVFRRQSAVARRVDALETQIRKRSA